MYHIYYNMFLHSSLRYSDNIIFVKRVIMYIYVCFHYFYYDINEIKNNNGYTLALTHVDFLTTYL